MSQQLIDQLDLNDLMYLQGTDASVSENKVLRKFYPEKTSFQNGEKILFRLHGRQFLDMCNSSLRFRVRFTGATVTAGPDNAPADPPTGSGSILNIFRRSRTISSTGVSISDVDNHNMLQRMATRLYRGESHNSVLGGVYGLNGSDSTVTKWQNGELYEFVVPMRMLNPFWENKQLLPPQITEGLSFELFTESLTRVGISSGLTKYEILNPELIADVYNVTPAIDSAVASMSNQRLVYEYKDWVQIESTMSVNSSSVALPMTYPLSNALEAFVTVRDVANANASGEDSFVTVPIGMGGNAGNAVSDSDQLVWRVGQIQLPQARMLGGPEIYNFLLNARNQIQSNTVTDFSLKRTNFDQGSKSWACYFVNLRRSNLFDNSGREVSNQQSLVAEIKINTPINAILDFFCCYVGRVVINDNFLTVEA